MLRVHVFKIHSHTCNITNNQYDMRPQVIVNAERIPTLNIPIVTVASELRVCTHLSGLL